MGEQLELIFEQSDMFYLAQQEYNDAVSDKKALEKLLQKVEMQINNIIKEKLIRMQTVCNHPEKHIEEFFNPHKCETDYTEFCDVCGKALRSWDNETD